MKHLDLAAITITVALLVGLKAGNVEQATAWAVAGFVVIIVLELLERRWLRRFR